MGAVHRSARRNGARLGVRGYPLLLVSGLHGGAQRDGALGVGCEFERGARGGHGPGLGFGVVLRGGLPFRRSVRRVLRVSVLLLKEMTV